MGIFTNLFKPGGDTIKGTLEGAGTLAKDLRSAITGDISPEKKAELELNIQELESKIILAQSEINKSESQSSNMFVAGARPFIMWVCGFGLLYHFLFRPLLSDLFSVYIGYTLQPIDSAGLMNMTIAILGLGIYRTVEKSQGVQANH